MKSAFLKISLLLSLILFVACGGKDAINLSTAEGINEMKKVILEKFDPEKEVYELSISTIDDLKSELGIITAYYLEGETMLDDNYSLFGPEPTFETEKGSIQGKTFIRNKKGKVKIKDFDYESINKKFNEGIALIGEEYHGFVLSDFSFNVDNDNKVTCDMKIEATMKGEGSSLKGKTIVTNFYEFAFEIDENGKVEPKQ